MMIIGMIVFWIIGMIFDLYTTFQRKEFLQYETNSIIQFLLEKTTIKKSIILYICFEVIGVTVIPIIFFWQIDFMYIGIFGIMVGINHVIAGMSNKNIIKNFDKNGLIP